MIEHLFVTPVYHHTLSLEKLQAVSQEIEEALISVRQSDLTNPWPDSVKTTFKYNTPNNNDVIKHKLNFLQTNIFDHITIYLKELGIQQPCKIDLTESWFNFGGRGAYQAVHNHLGSTLSAIYYHQTNEQDGDICFWSPCSSHSAFPFWRVANALGVKDAVAYKPQIGKLIIFPSYLLHAVYENKTEHERISIAFNFVIT
jgi:uncharacterized protein (TIGR02466 family)